MNFYLLILSYLILPYPILILPYPIHILPYLILILNLLYPIFISLGLFRHKAQCRPSWGSSMPSGPSYDHWTLKKGSH